MGFLGFHTLQESVAYTDAKNDCDQTVKVVKESVAYTDAKNDCDQTVKAVSFRDQGK